LYRRIGVEKEDHKILGIAIISEFNVRIVGDRAGSSCEGENEFLPKKGRHSNKEGGITYSGERAGGTRDCVRKKEMRER